MSRSDAHVRCAQVATFDDYPLEGGLMHHLVKIDASRVIKFILVTLVLVLELFILSALHLPLPEAVDGVVRGTNRYVAISVSVYKHEPVLEEGALAPVGRL